MTLEPTEESCHIRQTHEVLSLVVKRLQRDADYSFHLVRGLPSACRLSFTPPTPSRVVPWHEGNFLWFYRCLLLLGAL